MSESNKTLTLVGVAAAVLAVAILTRPTPYRPSTDEGLGGPLFADFKDPLAANSLEIVEFDEKEAVIKPFKIEQVNGVWTIPSHSNYPADAERQLGEAAASLIDLKKLSLASNQAGDQEIYQVIDPTSKEVTAASKGVGKLVKMTDSTGKTLVNLVIGKADETNPKIHFVRKADEMAIYRTEISVDKLSTNFADWIEKDLLKMNAFDLKQLVVNDHSVDELQRALVPRSLMTLDYSDTDSKWKVADLKDWDAKALKWDPKPLTADEELDSQKLNDLRSALDDLKIIDVARKPAGLAGDLREGSDLAKDREAQLSLARHGFRFAKIDNAVELFSNEGEVRAGMKDGVEYVLRFGRIAGQGSDADENADAKKEGDEKKDAAPDKKDEGSNEGASRYLLVMARFNQDYIAKPDLQPMPEAPKPEAPKTDAEKPAAPAGEKKEDAKPTDAKPADAKPSEPAKPTEPSKPAEPAKPAPDKGSSLDGAAESSIRSVSYRRTSTSDDQLAQADAEKPATAEKKPADEKPADAKPADPKDDAKTPESSPAADAKPAEAKPAAETKPSDAKPAAPATTPAAPAAGPDAAAKPATPPAKTELDLQRERVEKENQRKTDEYEQKVKAGKRRVQELNARFADWYYVISDKTYQKIHLTRADIVKKKEAPATDKEKTEAPSGGIPGLSPGVLPGK